MGRRFVGVPAARALRGYDTTAQVCDLQVRRLCPG